MPVTVPVFNIYSIGDSEFLEQIMIAVAMITGTADFPKLISVGLLLGALIITFQSIFQQAKEINYQQVLIGWIMYACFFGPSSTVTIEDGYTGQVRVVSNVPIGVGFTGGVISAVGYKITKLFEQGYSVATSITQKPFAEPLKILNETRRRTYDSAIFEALNVANGGGSVDFRKSWDNYIRECTLTKLDLGIITLEKMFKASYQEAFYFASTLYGTKLYISPDHPEGQDYTCTDAWTPLINATGYVTSAEVQKALAPIIGIKTVDQTPTGKITDSLTALGASSTSASNFIQMSLLEPLYFNAAMGKYQDMQDFTSAIMVNQAILQRNTQWATEHTMFMTTVRPMMTFFEGFVYAITPIMAFIIVLGSAGISMIVKYFQTVIWIQLWMPVLSIINLYIVTAAYGDINRFAVGGLNSLYALSGAGDKLDSWIATAGMLAAATPMISLFIVTGSTYAFTSLASRVGGSDHLNEKLSAPDALETGPVAKTMPTFSGNQYSGFVREGTQGMLSSASFGSNVSSGVSSSQARMDQAQQTFSQTLGRSITQGVSESEQFSRLSALGRTIGSMGSQQSQAITSKAQEIGKLFGVEASQADAVTGAVALQGALGADTGFLSNFVKKLSGQNKIGSAPERTDSFSGKNSLGAKFSAQAGAETKSSTSDKMQDVDKIMSGLNFQKSDSQALTNQLAHEAKSASTKSFSSTWGDTTSKQLSSAASNLLSSTETYQTMSGLQQSLGSVSNMDMKTLGAAVSNSSTAVNQLNEAIKYAPQDTRQRAAELENRYRTEGGMSPEVAQSAARLTALTDSGNSKPEDISRNFMSAAQVISTATGRDLSPAFGSMNPTKNSGLPTISNGNLDKEVGNATSNAQYLQPDDRKAQQIKAQSQQGVGSAAQVYGEHRHGMGRVGETHTENVQNLGGEKLQEAYQGVINKSAYGGEKLVTAAQLFGAISVAGERVSPILGRGDREKQNANNYQFAFDKLGFTHSQAKVYMAARSGSVEELERSSNAIFERYADKDRSGQVVRDDDGKPVLNEKNTLIANSILANIATVAQSDRDAAPALAIPLNKVNEAEGIFQPRK